MDILQKTVFITAPMHTVWDSLTVPEFIQEWTDDSPNFAFHIKDPVWALQAADYSCKAASRQALDLQCTRFFDAFGFAGNRFRICSIFK